MKNYEIIDTGITTKGKPYVLLKDTGNGMSITNAAEQVIKDLKT